METKKCISCKIDKPKNSEHFYYRNKTRGWLSSWCKECRKEKRGEMVCGLHVEYNLQYLPSEMNMKKSNSFNDGNHYSLEHNGRK